MLDVRIMGAEHRILQHDPKCVGRSCDLHYTSSTTTMRIDGTGNFVPPHIAKAYGVPATARPTSSPSPQPLASIGPAQNASPARLPTNAQALVAGRVQGPVEFDGVSVPRTNPLALNLYTRAADKIEAATAVQIGRTIDIKG